MSLRHIRSSWLLVILGASVSCGSGSETDGAAAKELTDSTRLREAPETIDIAISGETFTLEVAADIPLRQRGLMYRRHIDPSGGMLFVFPEPGFQSFWMGWCLVDIDIIYLDPQARITAMHQMKVESPQQPGETEEAYRERLPQYPSNQPAQFVIELAGGTLDRLSLAEGDTIRFPHQELVRLAR